MILDAANAVIVEFNLDAGNFTGQIDFVDVAMSARVTSGRIAARFFDREVSMVKVSVFYPNRPGSHFDMSYYCSKHIPMVQRLLGSTLKSVAVEEGIAGAIPGSPPTYVALGHLYFESIDAFVQAWGPQAQEIVGDVPNYTNCQPIIQISTVKI